MRLRVCNEGGGRRCQGGEAVEEEPCTATECGEGGQEGEEDSGGMYINYSHTYTVQKNFANTRR